MSERRSLLKTATADAHRALDHCLGKIETKQDYARYLASLTSFRAGMEREILARFPSGAYRPTLLHNTLLLDCADVGLEDVDILEPDFATDKETAFGIAYVLEGSTLGSPFLSRSAQALGYGEQFGARHLARQVSARSNWSLFIDVLEQEPELDMEKTSAAAIAAFDLALLAAQKAVNVPRR